MLKYWQENKNEINKKLFKYMIIHTANDHLLVLHRQRLQYNCLLNSKLALIVPDKLQQYVSHLNIQSSAPISIQSDRLQKNLQAKYQIEQRKKIQYMVFLYNNYRKIINIKNNFCFLSGRSRAVYRTFHLSRLKIREHAQHGQLIGLQKISW